MIQCVVLLALLAPFAPVIANPLFRDVGADGAAVGWSSVGAYRVLTSAGRRGSPALELTSDGSADRGAVQVITVSPPRSGAFAVTAWMRCEGVGEGGDCCLWLDVLQQDGPPMWGITGQPERTRTGWQHVRAVVRPTKAVREVQVFLLLRKAKGRVLFSELRTEPVLPAVASARAWRAGPRQVQVAAQLTAQTAWRITAHQSGREVARVSGNGDRPACDLPIAGPGPMEVRLHVPDAARPLTRIALPGSGDLGPGDSWAAGPTERVFEDDLPPLHARRSVRVDIARNERESFQVCIRPRAPSLRGLTVDAALSDQVQGRLAMDVRRVGYVHVATPFQHPFADRRGPAWWPDALLASSPLDAPTGTTRAFWVTVQAPAQARPGAYRGSVVFRAGDRVVARIPLSVVVHDVQLPLRARMKTSFALMDGHLRKLYGSVSPKLRRAYTDLLLDHRLNPDDISRSQPPDFDEMEYAASRGLNAFNVLNVVPEPKGDPLWVCYAELKDYTPEFRRRFFERLDALVPEIRRRGLLPYAYVYGFDERGPEYIPVIRDLFGEIRRRYPGMHTQSTCWPPPGTDPLSLNVDWFVPLSSSYEHSLAQTVRKRGGEIWWYVCMGPNHPYANWLIENPLIESRVIWWQAAQYGVEGILYWGLNIWERKNNDRLIALDADPRLAWSITTGGGYDWLNGDGVLLYPGVDGPIASLRLANIRDGIEDTELLRMYEDRFGPKAARSVIEPVTTDSTHFTRDPEVIRRARLRMLAKLASARSND